MEGRYFGEDPSMLKLNIQYNSMRGIRHDFWHTSGAPRKPPFIGKRQGQLRNEKITTYLVKNDKTGDPIMKTARGSFYLYRMSTLL